MKVDLQADNKQITARAKATVNGPDISGEANFTEYDVDGWKYVHIRLTLKGDPSKLAAGKHAVHIHEKGDCECDGFKCAGGHFDPGAFGYRTRGPATSTSRGSPGSGPTGRPRRPG